MSDAFAPRGPVQTAGLFAKLVKIEHTVFALPFAYVGALLAVDGIPSGHDLLWITVAMVGARSLAMALNRLIDMGIDAANPRTAGRELPSGAADGRRRARVLRRLALHLPVAVWQLDPIVRWLWPIPVAAFVIYPYLKRFTWLCHLWLGAVDALAPVGGWVAVTGRAAVGGVGARRRASATWVAGFDLFYSLFDVEIDRAAGAALVGGALRRARRVHRRARHARADRRCASPRSGSASARTRGTGSACWRRRCCSPTSTRSCGRATCAGSTRRSSR